LQYGQDSNNSTIRYATDEIYLVDSTLNLANNKALKIADVAGVYQNAINLSSGDDWFFGSDTGANYLSIFSGSGGIYQNVSGANVTQTVTGVFRPVPDGSVNLGGASNRWNTVYATTGAINTSDAREKQDIESLSDAEVRVAMALKGLVRKFRMRDAVAAKGDAARIHIGVIAQDVQAAFAAEGLDANHYGIVCFDVWDAEPEAVDDNGNVVRPAKAAGERFGIRYDEMLAFIIGVI
jgi:hypothetical protein